MTTDLFGHDTPRSARRDVPQQDPTKLDRLRAELHRWQLVMEERNKVQRPFANDFWSAHRALEKFRMTPEYSHGCHEVFALYDDRMAAGHLWHPFKAAFEEAERIVRELEREIKAIRGK